MQNKKMLASILFFFIGFVSMAQGATPPPPMPPPPPGTPIDDHILVLLVLALSYGVCKAFKISAKKA